MSKTIDGSLSSLDFSDVEIAKVKKGEVVNKTQVSTNERELAGAFAMTCEIDLEKLQEIFMTGSIKQETDSAITQISNIQDPEHPDFSAIQLNDASAKEYLKAKPGDSFNLSKSEYELFQALPKGASVAQVEEALQKVMTQRFHDYRNNGLEGLAPYQRAREAYEPGKELMLKTTKSAKIHEMCPEFQKYLLEYPNHKPENVLEIFSWINFTIDDKSTLCLVHKIGYTGVDDSFFMCERHFYVSRGHNSMQGVGVGFAVGEKKDTAAVAYCSRTSTDQVTGFGGSAKRTIGANVMCGRLAENFQRRRVAAAKK